MDLDIISFLKVENLLHLSTLNSKSMSETVSVYYYFDEKDLALFFMAPHNSSKIKNILGNANVSGVITNPIDCKTAQFQGVASIERSTKPFETMIACLKKLIYGANHWPLPIDQIKGAHHLELIRIDLEHIKFSNYNNGLNQTSALVWNS